MMQQECKRGASGVYEALAKHSHAVRKRTGAVRSDVAPLQPRKTGQTSALTVSALPVRLRRQGSVQAPLVSTAQSAHCWGSFVSQGWRASSHPAIRCLYAIRMHNLAPSLAVPLRLPDAGRESSTIPPAYYLRHFALRHCEQRD